MYCSCSASKNYADVMMSQKHFQDLNAYLRSLKLMLDSGPVSSDDCILKGFMSGAILTNILGDRTIELLNI